METLRYFYHPDPDHLGSTSWVTDSAKNGVQYCEYLPYGEPLVDQRSTTWNSRYTFSGKERDSETGYSYFGARYYHSDLNIWLSVDPLSDKYPNLTPYAYCANNPVNFIAPDGRSYSEFDENGNYLRTIKDNWWHNTFVGRKGRIIDENGNISQTFRFADPKNDVANLKNGTINKVHFVQENEITSMLSKAGAFNEENKVYNNDLANRYDYIKEEGQGGGKFDFSYNTITGIPAQYFDASSNPLNQPSSMLFLVDGVAHNHMNFGIFYLV